MEKEIPWHRDYWPACGHEIRPWRQTVRGGSKADRTLTQIEVTLPPLIADLDVPLPQSLIPFMEHAMREIIKLDATANKNLSALSLLLLRTESVASSKIESVEASVQDFARALYGDKSNDSAVSMVSATRALTSMINDSADTQCIDLPIILGAHKSLMEFELAEQQHAGKLRDVQNWIGGSDYSPRNAIYLPPPPELVGNLIDDLIKFCNRDDLPAFVQSTIAHAQFETIHPFTDGNGRIGRALINAILRRRGVTTQVVLPIASALVAQRQKYFDALDEYRLGKVAPILEAFTKSAIVVARESQVTAENLERVFSGWREIESEFRSDATTGRLFTKLAEMPIFAVDDAVASLKVSQSSAYLAIQNLHQFGVINPLTDRKRNQIWGVTAILDEIEDLSIRTSAALAKA